jgi:plasmid stabilization system protein ParE
MATVIWTVPAQMIRKKFYLQGMRDFGTTVANKTDEIIEEIENDLAKWPETGFPEPLLKSNPRFFRARHINKRYKIIYWYDESNDTVVIEDIWDTRRAPQNLTKRIKNKK